MSIINTRYLGFDLSSPIIVGSSNFTSRVESIVEAEAAGAGAVVLKSLFEEQIVSQAHSLSSQESYPEADDYLKYYTRTNSVDAYLDLIAGARKKVKIPVIASINCFSPEGWIDFALEIEKAGASALEVNIFFVPTDKQKSSADSEKVYFRIIDNLKRKLKIPAACASAGEALTACAAAAVGTTMTRRGCAVPTATTTRPTIGTTTSGFVAPAPGISPPFGPKRHQASQSRRDAPTSRLACLSWSTRCRRGSPKTR